MRYIFKCRDALSVASRDDCQIFDEKSPRREPSSYSRRRHREIKIVREPTAHSRPKTQRVRSITVAVDMLYLYASRAHLYYYYIGTGHGFDFDVIMIIIIIQNILLSYDTPTGYSHIF